MEASPFLWIEDGGNKARFLVQTTSHPMAAKIFNHGHLMFASDTLDRLTNDLETEARTRGTDRRFKCLLSRLADRLLEGRGGRYNKAGPRVSIITVEHGRYIDVDKVARSKFLEPWNSMCHSFVYADAGCARKVVHFAGS